MNDLMIIALLLLACLAMLIILLIRQNASLHRQEEGRLRQEQGLENLGNQLLDELDAQRDQTMDSLYQGNQHLMATLSQISQSQSNLLENMLASVYKGMGEMQSVAAGVGDLPRILVLDDEALSEAARRNRLAGLETVKLELARLVGID